MFQWGKSSKNLAAPAAAVGEVPVQKVEKIEDQKIEVLNLVAIKPGQRRPQPPEPDEGPGKPNSPRSDDINLKARRFIDDTKKRWYLGHKSFRATGRR